MRNCQAVYLSKIDGCWKGLHSSSFVGMFHIVDDQTSVGNVYSGLLSRLGYETKVFPSPKEYLKYASSSDFAMPYGTITNVAMPEMNGFEMMKRVHHKYPELKFVVATGMPEQTDHPHRLNACMYLSKPFHIDELKEVAGNLFRCHMNGPSEAIGCDACDHRDFFDITDWICPQAEASEAFQQRMDVLATDI